jgi:hypothetical protein
VTLAVLLLLAALADIVTMLALPPGAERNPLAVAVPPVAVALKVVVALALASLVIQRRRYFRFVGLVAITAWTIGFAANLAVLT